MGHSLIKEYAFLMLRVLSDTDFSILNRISSRVTSESSGCQGLSDSTTDS